MKQILAIALLLFCSSVVQAQETIMGGYAVTNSVGDAFHLLGDNFYLHSGTPEGGQGVVYELTQVGDLFQLVTTIRAMAAPLHLGLPCFGGQSVGMYDGIAADCLQGSLQIKAILPANPFTWPSEHMDGDVTVSGTLSGWDSDRDGTSTKLWDVDVQGTGTVSISSGPGHYFGANYNLTHPNSDHVPAPAPTPEPATWLSLGMGLAGVLFCARRATCRSGTA